MTTLEEKVKWLEDWGKENSVTVFDVLNGALVDDFVSKFKVGVRITNFGANVCPNLGRTLSKAYKEGLMTRGRVSISVKEKGFPNWVYVYSHKTAK